MSTASETQFKRNILETATTEKVSAILQQNLTNLVDLALVLKQAHWNVVGPNFRSIHLQLDEIVETVRDAGDEVAERISATGTSPDGRASSVAQGSELESYPGNFVNVQETVTRVADSIKATLETMRKSIQKLGDLDPVSEDLLIGIAGPLEKHLWMLQAQED